MKWWPALAIAAVGLAGCQAPRGPSDPFLRTTVPPPQTGQFATPPGAYYTPGVAGAPVVSPGAPGAPPPVYGSVPAAAPPAYGSAPPAYGGVPPANYGSPPPATYAPPAGMPDSMPTTPSSAPPIRYAPPGAFNYPQSSLDRTKAVNPGSASGQGAGPTLARSSRARSRLVGGPQSASPASRADAASQQDAGSQSASAASDDSGQSTIAAPAVAIVPRLDPSAVQQASFNQPVGDADAQSNGSSNGSSDVAGSSSPSATPASRLVASDSATDGSAAEPLDSAANPLQSANSTQQPAGVPLAVSPQLAVASASVPEITDLPAATGSDTLRAYGASRSRLVFTRANRPVSPSSTTVSTAGSAAGITATSAAMIGSAGAQSTAPPASTPRSGYGVSDDYGTLSGKLEYSQARRQWKLRYIPIDGQTDGYGGSVLLPDAGALANFHPGDFVVARGQVASAGSKQGFSPEYDLQQIAAQ